MKTNEELQKDVQDAIKWEPLLNAAEIGVTAKNGVITLTGVVDSYAKKIEAEKAAKSVSGVKAIAETIEINFGTWYEKNDTELANDVLDTFKWSWKVPGNQIKVKVENGWVTLEGEVNWNFQSEAAKTSIENLTGVKGVENNIIIKPDHVDPIEQKDIENAIERNWSMGNHQINVLVVGNSVTLTGRINSLFQKDEAERIVWKTPGVNAIDNQLVIGYDD